MGLQHQGTAPEVLREAGSRGDEELLTEVVARLRSRFRVVAVILFGSRARGDWGLWSDYDLLIIGEFSKGFTERIREVLELVSDIPLPIEPLPYTLDEAINLLRRGSPTIYDALEEGRVLYADKSFEALKKLFEELKRKGVRKGYTSILVPMDC